MLRSDPKEFPHAYDPQDFFAGQIVSILKHSCFPDCFDSTHLNNFASLVARQADDAFDYGDIGLRVMLVFRCTLTPIYKGFTPFFRLPRTSSFERAYYPY